MKNIKRMGVSALAAILAVSALAGCSNAATGTSTSSEAGSSEAADLSGELNLIGSTSMEEVCNALGAAFTEKYPDVTVNKGGTGSGEAAQAVTNGTAAIGDLSRDLKDDENPDSFDVHQIAIDGIAVVVNTKNQVADLTQEQIGKIFTGEIKNWSEVGGADGDIIVIGRDAASGTRDGFESIFDVKEKCTYAEELDSTGKVKEKVKSDANAIGYISLGSVDDTVTALKVDGVEATEDNIKNDSYKVSRPFIEICKKGSTDELVTAWFDFIYSEEGQQVISDAKLIPVEK